MVKTESQMLFFCGFALFSYCGLYWKGPLVVHPIMAGSRLALPTSIMLSFRTKVAYDIEILHGKKKEQFLIFIYASVLSGDMFFEDGGYDFKQMNCCYFRKYANVNIGQCFHKGEVIWEN